MVVFFRYEFRYQAILLRARFDQNKNEIDMRKAKKLLMDGEKELLLKQHCSPLKCKLINCSYIYIYRYCSYDYDVI